MPVKNSKPSTGSKKRRTTRFGPKEIAPGQYEGLLRRVVAAAFAYDLIPPDGNEFSKEHLLLLLVRDFVPAPKKRGRKGKWAGQLGHELVEAVKATMEARRSLNVEAAIRELQDQPKWENEPDLNKRYYEALRYYTARQFPLSNFLRDFRDQHELNEN